MTAENPADGAAIIDLRDFMRRVGLSKQTVYRLMAAGDAPPRIQLSTRRFGFRVRDVDHWLEQRTQPAG